MSRLPPFLAIVLLAGAAGFAGFLGCGPATFDAGRAPEQLTQTDDPQPKSPMPERPIASPPTMAAAKTAPVETAPGKIATVKNAAVKTAAVKIDNFAFEPSSLTVAPGTTVEWTNHDDVPHTVVEKTLRFKSQALDTDDHYRHTFNAPGVYPYFCSIHPHMTGEIHVKP